MVRTSTAKQQLYLALGPSAQPLIWCWAVLPVVGVSTCAKADRWLIRRDIKIMLTLIAATLQEPGRCCADTYLGAINPFTGDQGSCPDRHPHTALSCVP